MDVPQRLVITGGARGIGAVATKAFVQSGAKVVIFDRREGEAEHLMTLLGAESCRFIKCDVTSSAEVSRAMANAVDWLGGLDVLINVAGLDRPASAEDMTEADWDLVMNTNAKGAMLTNKAALQHMRAAGGRIINFTSIYGVRGGADRAAYSAAKAAIIGWTRAAARDWGRFNITVNAIAPIMATEVANKSIALLSEQEQHDLHATLQREIPLGGRMGDVERDLVPMLILLAGTGGSYITGQVINVDGGMLIG